MKLPEYKEVRGTNEHGCTIVDSNKEIVDTVLKHNEQIAAQLTSAIFNRYIQNDFSTRNGSVLEVYKNLLEKLNNEG